MKHLTAVAVSCLVCTLFFSGALFAQSISVGGRAGLSSVGYGGYTSTGFQIGPAADYEFKKDMLIGTDLTLNSQNGTPIGWANYFKYLISLQNSQIVPYVDGGFSLWFATGGPYFGIQFGGGAYFPLTKDFSIPADIQLGPIFTTGSNTFYFALTSGIRYTIPSH
jgi:hypothetical protein